MSLEYKKNLPREGQLSNVAGVTMCGAMVVMVEVVVVATLVVIYLLQINVIKTGGEKVLVAREGKAFQAPSLVTVTIGTSVVVDCAVVNEH